MRTICKPRATSSTTPRWYQHGAVVLLLCVLFGLLLSSAQALTYTADEPAHVAGGYALLKSGPEALEMLAQRGYPPLMPVLEAALVVLRAPEIPIAQLDGWPDYYDVFAQAFVDALPELDWVMVVSRLPAIWLTILLAALVARWGTELFGGLAGLLAVGLLIFDPTLLAHGSLATTDVGITLFGTATLYATWRWMRSGGWRWALGLGLLLGATFLTKLSAPIWAGCVAVLATAGVVRAEPPSRRRKIGQVGAAVLLGGLTLWTAYGFQWGRAEGLGLPVPAPAYWESGLYLTGYASRYFALGQRLYQPRWWYFPVAFLIKNPVSLLITWIGSGLLLLARRERWGALALLAFFPIVYAGVAMAEGMDIGYRHLLPVHPFLHLIGGGGLMLWWRSRRGVWRWLVALLAAWSIVVVTRIHPNQLAFFNVLVGGPREGYRYLVDSNLDWGQSGRAVGAYLADHPTTQVAPPETELRPAAGRYVMGASELQGIGIADPYAYEWFRHQTPVDDIGYSILVFDVDPLPVRWVAQCGAPALPLDEDELEAGLGQQESRAVSFDCTAAWHYPDGGRTAGLYALSYGLLAEKGRQFPGRLALGRLAPQPLASWLLARPPAPRDKFISRHLAPTSLSFVNRHTSHPFALYELDPGTIDGAEAGADVLRSLGIENVRRVSAASGPAGMASTERCEPVGSVTSQPACRLEGPAGFMGAYVVSNHETVEVETWWSVEDGPIAQNFSIMAHLLDAEGAALGTADGLGVSPVVLQTGDVFVQRHRFTNPGADGPLYLRTGAYWLDTMRRWSTGPGTDAFLVAVTIEAQAPATP